jgi:hypothetical protein
VDEVLPTEHRDRDGFRILQTRVELPLDNAGLDLELQTDLLICHLFVNDGRSIAAITHLGFDRQRIVRALLEHSVIQNRRQGSSRQQITSKKRQGVCTPETDRWGTRNLDRQAGSISTPRDSVEPFIS